MSAADYRSGERPSLDDTVRHYMDGDIGSVAAIDGRVVTVHWQGDAANASDHHADELSLVSGAGSYRWNYRLSTWANVSASDAFDRRSA